MYKLICMVVLKFLEECSICFHRSATTNPYKCESCKCKLNQNASKQWIYNCALNCCQNCRNVFANHFINLKGSKGCTGPPKCKPNCVNCRCERMIAELRKRFHEGHWPYKFTSKYDKYVGITVVINGVNPIQFEIISSEDSVAFMAGTDGYGLLMHSHHQIIRFRYNISIFL